MNTVDYLLASARADTAVLDGDVAYSHADLREAVAKLAAELESGPTEVGDRVGIVGRNSFFWIAAYLATLYAGRVAVPFPVTVTVEEAANQAAWVEMRALFADRSQAKRLAAIGDRVVTITEAALGEDRTALPWSPRPVRLEDPAVLQLTSGTTAAPKAVIVSHENLQANTSSIIEYLELNSDDRMLVVLPFSYCFGASLLHTHLRVGGSVALCHTLAFPQSVCDAIDKHRCTGMAGVPSTYQLLMRASTLLTRPLASLRHLQQAGGRLAPALVDKLAAAQPQSRLFVMYGQTEATARLSYLPPEHLATRRGSIGRGIPGLRLRVVDEHDQDVAPSQVGEIIASGPSITTGYWKNPEATAAKYRGGFLRTGDLATVDEDGFIYIVDRISDFIKSWGVRISSQEIEEAALGIDGVEAAAAVGVPDELAGERIALFVVTGTESVSEASILSSLRSSLAKHMVPDELFVVPELPVNSNGKPVKSELRTIAVDLRDRDRAMSDR